MIHEARRTPMAGFGALFVHWYQGQVGTPQISTQDRTNRTGPVTLAEQSCSCSLMGHAGATAVIVSPPTESGCPSTLGAGGLCVVSVASRSVSKSRHASCKVGSTVEMVCPSAACKRPSRPTAWSRPLSRSGVTVVALPMYGQRIRVSTERTPDAISLADGSNKFSSDACISTPRPPRFWKLSRPMRLMTLPNTSSPLLQSTLWCCTAEVQSRACPSSRSFPRPWTFLHPTTSSTMVERLWSAAQAATASAAS